MYFGTGIPLSSKIFTISPAGRAVVITNNPLLLPSIKVIASAKVLHPSSVSKSNVPSLSENTI